MNRQSGIEQNKQKISTGQLGSNKYGKYVLNKKHLEE